MWAISGISASCAGDGDDDGVKRGRVPVARDSISDGPLDAQTSDSVCPPGCHADRPAMAPCFFWCVVPPREVLCRRSAFQSACMENQPVRRSLSCRLIVPWNKRVNADSCR